MNILKLCNDRIHIPVAPTMAHPPPPVVLALSVQLVVIQPLVGRQVMDKQWINNMQVMNKMNELYGTILGVIIL